MTYWIIVIFAFVLNLQSENTYKINTRETTIKIKGKYVFLVIMAFVLVLLVSLRKNTVGTDTSMYESQFYFVKAGGDYWLTKSGWRTNNVEIGYYTLEWLFSRFGDYILFQSICAILSIIPVIIVIGKYSKDYFNSIFTYIAFGYYTFCMTGMRQAIAIGLCALAYISIIERKLIKFVVLVIIASTFHISALIFLPAYLLPKIEFNRKTISIYFFVWVGFFALRSSLLNLFNKYARYSYLASNTAGGERMFLFMTAFFLLLLIEHRTFFKGKNNTLLFWMLAAVNLLIPIVSANAVLFRLYYYFHIFYIIALPEFIAIHNKKTEQILYFCAFSIVGLYLLANYVINSPEQYVPFLFYWQ